MSKTLLLLSLPVLLAACSATTGQRTEAPALPPVAPRIVVDTKIVDTSCDWAKPIYVKDADVLTDSTADQIRAHNETGAKHCGWKPSSKK